MWMHRHILTDEVVRSAGMVLGSVRNWLERFEEDRESFAMSRVAAVEHHDRPAVVVEDVAVDVLGATHLHQVTWHESLTSRARVTASSNVISK